MAQIADHFDDIVEGSDSTDALSHSASLLLQSSGVLVEAVYSDSMGVLVCQRLISTLTDSIADLNSSLSLLPEPGLLRTGLTSDDAASISDKSPALLESVKHLVASSLKTQV